MAQGPRSSKRRQAFFNTARTIAEALECRLLLTTTTWTNPAGGDFDTAANWSNGVPSAGVDAVVNVPISAPITKSASTTDVFASLTTTQPVVLSGGVLDVMGNVTASSTFTLNGGTLKDAVFSSTGAGSLAPTSSGGILDGVTLASNVVIPSGANLQVQDGLTLNNAVVTLNSGNASANTVMTFVNTGTPQTLGGTGELRLSHASTYSFFGQLNFNGGLTIAPAIEIDGGGATLQTNGALTNQGTISADVTGQSINITGTGTLQNQGTLSATNAGALNASTLTGNIGSGVSLSGVGSALSLNGQNYVVNAGLSAPGGTRLALGGTWSNSAGSTIAATSATLTLGDTQAWSNAGTITANSSTVTLGGVFTAAGLGTFNRTGGTVNLSGAEDVQGGALAFTPSTGSWNLAGGTISNATITFAGGASLVPTSSGGVLNDVILGSNLTLPPGSAVNVQGGLTLNNAVVTINASNATAYTTLSFTDSALPQTLGGAGSVVFVPNSNSAFPGRILVNGNSTANSALTIATGIEIHGGGGQIVAGNILTENGIINQGTIQSDLNGQSIAISGGGIDNQGALAAVNGATLTIAATAWTNESDANVSATGGSTLTLGGAWINQGTITETGSTLNLGGTFTQTAAGLIVRSGGTINLTGTDDVQGGTFAFTAASGSWNLAGGTLKNATLTFTGGNSLVTTSLGGILDDVTLASDLLMAMGTAFSVPDTLTLDNSTLTISAHASVSFIGYGYKTLAGNGEVVLEGDPTSGQLAGIYDTDGALGISSGIEIDGGVASIVIYNSSFENFGVISADISGESIAISGLADNEGTFSAVNGATLNVGLSNNYEGALSATGGSTLTIQGNWTNEGTISETDSTLNLGGQSTAARMGTITRSGGTINLTGQFSGTFSLTPQTGSWNLAGGSLWQGGLTFSGGASLVPTSSGGTLNQMILNSDLTVPAGASLTAVNGLILNSANLILDGSSTFTFNAAGYEDSLEGDGSSALIFAGDSASGNIANLDVISSSTQPMFNDTTIRGGGGNINLQSSGEALRNYGVISADVSGQSINITGPGALTNNLGTLEAAGGTLAYQGNLTLGTGTLEIGIGGVTPGAGCGQLQITGAATLAGTLEATLLNGYVPVRDQSFTVITYASYTGSFQKEILNSSGTTFTASINPTNVILAPVAAPLIQTNPISQTVLAGSTATFTAAADANPAATVQWQVSTDEGNSFSNISGATSATYSFTAALAQTGDEFQAVFTNSQGVATTSAATLTVFSNPLLDYGFESPSVGAGTLNAFAYDPTNTGWVFSGDAGVTDNGSGFTALNSTAPEGTQVGFLQGAGSSISQQVTTAAGTYAITFEAAQRVQWQTGLQDFDVLVDGSVIATIKPQAGGAYAAYQTIPFTLSAGMHTITFQGLDSAGGDNTALLDEVELAPATQSPPPPPPPAGLIDAGFESPSVGSGTFGAFDYDPTNAGWTFTGMAGISGNGSGFTAANPNAPEGNQVGFLQGAGSSIGQTISLSGGTYEITFEAAQRVQWQNGSQDFQVLVDGIVVGTFEPQAGGSYAAYQTAPFVIATSGTHAIIFQGLDSAGGDNTALIDAVQLAPISTQPPPAQPADAGFESPSVGSGTFSAFVYDPTNAGWTFTGDAGISGNGSGFTALNPDAPEGTQVAFIQGAGSSIGQQVTTAAGTYALTFEAAQRVQWQTGLQDFEILVDGSVVGTFKPPAGGAYTAYQSSPFTLSAGMHTINFQGLDSVGGDNTALIDAVAIVAAG